MERREASYPATFWKSSETNTQRNEEREMERGERKDQPPGGQRRTKLRRSPSHKIGVWTLK